LLEKAIEKGQFEGLAIRSTSHEWNILYARALVMFVVTLINQKNEFGS